MRTAVAVAAVSALAAGAAAVAWFEPHKLVLDDRTDAPRPEGRVVAGGAFRGLEHDTTGTVSVVDQGDGRRSLFFDDLDTSNGPDLRVYLSAAPADAPWGAFDDDYVELGPLRGNIGDQSYDIPAGTDVGRHRTAVIWCKRFSVPFASADLGVT